MEGSLYLLVSATVEVYFKDFQCRSFILFHYLGGLYALVDVLDVYIDKRGRIWIIDFNVFGEPTSSLLFDWTELLSPPLLCHQVWRQTAVVEGSEKLDATDTTEVMEIFDLEDRFRVIESEADLLPRYSITIVCMNIILGCTFLST